MNKKDKVLMTLLLLFALCCELYGLKVFLAGSGTAFFAVWLVIGVILAALAFAVKYRVWQKLPRSAKVAICIVLCIGILFFAVTEVFILSHFFDKGAEDLDYIIILGAQVYETGPSPILNCRLWAALQYLNRNPDTVCIVSGGQGYNEPFPEAVGMANYLVENGISPDRIIQEPESNTTKENLEFSKRLIPDTNASVGIVTNNFHVFRALQAAKRAGIDNSCGIAAFTPIGFLPNNLLREFLGVIKFYITA